MFAVIGERCNKFITNTTTFSHGRSQGGWGGGASTPWPTQKKRPNLISISLLLILIKNPNLIFSFDRNSNLD